MCYGMALHNRRRRAASHGLQNNLDHIVGGKIMEWTIYRIFFKNGDIYVGQSSQVEDRIASHEKNKEIDYYESLGEAYKYEDAIELETYHIRKTLSQYKSRVINKIGTECLVLDEEFMDYKDYNSVDLVSLFDNEDY